MLAQTSIHRAARARVLSLESSMGMEADLRQYDKQEGWPMTKECKD